MRYLLALTLAACVSPPSSGTDASGADGAAADLASCVSAEESPLCGASTPSDVRCCAGSICDVFDDADGVQRHRCRYLFVPNSDGGD